jgi:hypothetical protein
VKVRLESGERLVVEVPVRLATCAAVSIQAESLPPSFASQLTTHFSQHLVDVTIEDGLIDTVNERVIRRHAEALRTEDRLVLWGHIISQHASCVGLDMTLEELIKLHEHEHDGPGTIRNHPRTSREYSLHKIGQVLIESDR